MVKDNNKISSKIKRKSRLKNENAEEKAGGKRLCYKNGYGNWGKGEICACEDLEVTKRGVHMWK